MTVTTNCDMGEAYGIYRLGDDEACMPYVAHVNIASGDWIDEEGHRRFFASDWKLQAKSNRTGLRLTGPEFTFAPRAYDKRPEHGQHPSNILDHGYPLGAISLAGQTPIILVNDAPSTGGFINPYTVPTATFWKLAQSRPGDIYRFIEIDIEAAQALRRQLDRLCSLDSLEPL
jgi:urea carboxylase